MENKKISIKTGITLFGNFLYSFFFGAFFGSFVGFLLYFTALSDDPDFIETVFRALGIALLAIPASIVVALPTIPLGYLISYAMYQRERQRAWEWILAGMFVGWICCFGLYSYELTFWHIYLLAGAISGHIMSRRVKSAIQQSTDSFV
ncbi:MAG: hypothetical protein ABW072_11665 [Sedimenticola sp.]